jgi:hypothetical protein
MKTIIAKHAKNVKETKYIEQIVSAFTQPILFSYSCSQDPQTTSGFMPNLFC